MKNVYDFLPKAEKNACENLYPEEKDKDGLIAQAADFYSESLEKAETLFGYPSYNVKLSEKTKALLLMHYSSCFSNNCGDISEADTSNYALDSKFMERKIVRIFSDKFGMGENAWGYVTSGGSESNFCGIDLAFIKNPDAMLYYSASAHYSVTKHAAFYPNECIPVSENEKMNAEALKSRILTNYKAKGLGANIVLTFGTTKFGAIDDIDDIVDFLTKHSIPYFLHVDAALFGGIPNNQIDAPLLLNAKERGIHSVAVSLHKYIGFKDVKSVFVSVCKPNGTDIEYIGQKDTTVTGSRSIPAFALYNHLKERLFNVAPYEYVKNINFFENLLKENGINYSRCERSNIFVVDCPDEQTCKDFQLSSFTVEENGELKTKAHFIIFPHHTEEMMIKAVNRLKK